MSWGKSAWGTTSQVSPPPSAAWGASGTPTPLQPSVGNPKSRYLRVFLQGLPFGVNPQCQSLLSEVIDLLEVEDYNIAGPIK